jgi:hypothetical protein
MWGWGLALARPNHSPITLPLSAFHGIDLEHPPISSYAHAMRLSPHIQRFMPPFAMSQYLELQSARWNQAGRGSTKCR